MFSATDSTVARARPGLVECARVAAGQRGQRGAGGVEIAVRQVAVHRRRRPAQRRPAEHRPGGRRGGGRPRDRVPRRRAGENGAEGDGPAGQEPGVRDARAAAVAPEPALQRQGHGAEPGDRMTASRVGEQAVGDRAEGQPRGGREVHGGHSPDRPERGRP